MDEEFAKGCCLTEKGAREVEFSPFGIFLGVILGLILAGKWWISRKKKKS